MIKCLPGLYRIIYRSKPSPKTQDGAWSIYKHMVSVHSNSDSSYKLVDFKIPLKMASGVQIYLNQIELTFRADTLGQKSELLSNLETEMPNADKFEFFQYEDDLKQSQLVIERLEKEIAGNN